MDTDKAVEDLREVGCDLNKMYGSKSYEMRCKLYDIRMYLIAQQEVKNTVDLGNETIAQIVDKYRKTNITNKDFSDRLTKAKKT